MNSARALIVLGLVLALLVGAGVVLQEVLQPAAEIVASLDPACDLGKAACRSAVAGGAVEFSMKPYPFAPMKPLTVEVATEGLTVDRVEVDFTGVDMNMGYNRFVLVPTAPGRFTGTAILPVCVRDRMEWEAKVLVEARGTRLSVPFRFETRRGD